MASTPDQIPDRGSNCFEHLTPRVRRLWEVLTGSHCGTGGYGLSPGLKLLVSSTNLGSMSAFDAPAAGCDNVNNGVDFFASGRTLPYS